ncbi:MAG TPA: tRNA preQ1(34) S-adenosylmethionine ribosyltransferase-isomerase QueA [Acidobacteriota bacterium]|nr:tRNA preQ1(34) S-adenosylmethionine ribosyltransferase-isomerase QueA [Acidobacteriota bacterium]HQG90373.1 tRNA preQ1(34) S-adenosylmethionine ribosyltransferase-isomerase QueA [Acidobacteriota bacterium]
MTLSDFQYELPPDRIAQLPADRREEARMMIVDRAAADIRHARVADLSDTLRSDDLLVLNDTRVIPARLFGIKAGSGAAVELLLLRRLDGGTWKAMVRPGRRLRDRAEIRLPAGARARVAGAFDDGTRAVALDTPLPLDDYLDAHGVTPLPPYIRRTGNQNEAFHRLRYQTVFAREPGSVAAPTAGLHFTPAVLDRLTQRGVEIVSLTLHVGLGTFKPVQVEDITRHQMDPEGYTLTPDAATRIQTAREMGRRVVAVGTTVTRTLEHLARSHDGRIVPGSGWTSLFIYPGHEFRVVGALLTNFHLPGSTLLMLVAAFAGREFILTCYRQAVDARYRFYSYGDCMLIV